MKISRLVLLASFLLLLATAAPSRAYHRGPRLSLDVSVFYDGLAPYGSWYSSPRLGLVWAPYGVAASWQPYSYGRWVYTDYGWTWVSDYEWGWAPFHYGRWDFDPVLGWVWVPGTEWAPAWVDFYRSDGYVGWAPLPPGVGFSSRFRPRAPDACLFVPEREFLAPRVGRWNGPVSHRRALLRRAANVTRYQPARGTYVNRSVSVDRIERATHRRVAPYRVVDTRARTRTRRERGREIEMFRPEIRSTRPAHRPAVARMPRPRVGSAPHASVSGSRGRSRERGRGHAAAPSRIHRKPAHVHSRPPAHRLRATASHASHAHGSRATPHRAHGARAASHPVHRQHSARAPRARGRAPARQQPPHRRARGRHHGHGRPPVQ